MEEIVKERLKQYLDYKHLSQNEFARQCGINSTSLTRLKPNTSKATLGHIDRNSDLNIQWLLTGEGNMLKPATQNANNITGHNVCGVNVNGRDIDIKCPSEYETLLNIVSNHNNIVAKMQAQLDKAQSQIDELIAILKAKL